MKKKLRTDQPNSVFIVHGHDLKARDELDAHLRSLNLNTIILDQKPNNSRPLIEKFERYATQSTLAICILTPDDMVTPSGTDEEKRRARQNVILEMGYFFGKLGRERVILLYRNGVEIPSDIYGVTYIQFKDIASVEGKVDRELKELHVI